MTLGKLDVTFSSTVRTIFFVLIFYGGFFVKKKRFPKLNFEVPRQLNEAMVFKTTKAKKILNLI